MDMNVLQKVAIALARKGVISFYLEKIKALLVLHVLNLYEMEDVLVTKLI